MFLLTNAKQRRKKESMKNCRNELNGTADKAYQVTFVGCQWLERVTVLLVLLVVHAVCEQTTESVQQQQQQQQQDQWVEPSESNIGRPPLEVTTNKSPVSCEQAYARCALRKVCAPALSAYNEHCGQLSNANGTSECSQMCLKAMIALRSSDLGEDLMSCDCEDDEYCVQSKRRSEACRPQVELAVEPQTSVACSTASWICMADQLCSTALEFYYSNCQTLFSSPLRYCSQRCNNSLSILYRQPKASKLITCQCDGSEDFPCAAYKTYTERLCLNRHSTNNRVNDEDASDDNEANSSNSAESNQEENPDLGSNLTNDPEGSFVLDSPLSFGASEEQKNTHHDQDDNSKIPENDENSSNLSQMQDNAVIQTATLADDNWIPLMSPRYFTNLERKRHHQNINNNREHEQVVNKQTKSQQAQQQQQQQTSSRKRRRHHTRLTSEFGAQTRATRERPNPLLNWSWLLANNNSSSLTNNSLQCFACLLVAIFTYFLVVVDVDIVVCLS